MYMVLIYGVGLEILKGYFRLEKKQLLGTFYQRHILSNKSEHKLYDSILVQNTLTKQI